MPLSLLFVSLVSSSLSLCLSSPACYLFPSLCSLCSLIYVARSLPLFAASDTLCTQAGNHVGNFSSSLSHSCSPNCTTATAVRDGRLCVKLTTTKAIAYGKTHGLLAPSTEQTVSRRGRGDALTCTHTKKAKKRRFNIVLPTPLPLPFFFAFCFYEIGQQIRCWIKPFLLCFRVDRGFVPGELLALTPIFVYYY